MVVRRRPSVSSHVHSLLSCICISAYERRHYRFSSDDAFRRSLYRPCITYPPSKRSSRTEPPRLQHTTPTVGRSQVQRLPRDVTRKINQAFSFPSSSRLHATRRSQSCTRFLTVGVGEMRYGRERRDLHLFFRPALLLERGGGLMVRGQRVSPCFTSTNRAVRVLSCFTSTIVLYEYYRAVTLAMSNPTVSNPTRGADAGRFSLGGSCRHSGACHV